MSRIAVYDIGTVSCRLAVMDVSEEGKCSCLLRKVEICNLGEGVDATHVLKPAAIKRVVECMRDYKEEAESYSIDGSICICTSAARDAENSDKFVDSIKEIGLYPQVISGDVEAKLTFLGVAQDFVGQTIGVVDSGGGSTEFCIGRMLNSGELVIEWVHSFDIGARRITERFFLQDPPSKNEVKEAHEYALGVYRTSLDQVIADGLIPDVIVGVGGSATTLVSVIKKMEVYNSSEVHLSKVSVEDIAQAENLFNSMVLNERANIVGLQAKRAPVISGGVVAISELLEVCGKNTLTVSESDLLFGLAVVGNAILNKLESSLEWKLSLQ